MYVSSSRPSGGLTDDITSTAILHNSDECPHPHTRSYPTCHNLKYTNTNTKTLLQIQLYKYKHTSTNAHMKIHDSDECPPRLPSAPTRCRLVIISKVKSFSFFLCSDGSLCWRKTNKETKVLSSSHPPSLLNEWLDRWRSEWGGTRSAESENRFFYLERKRFSGFGGSKTIFQRFRRFYESEQGGKCQAECFVLF